MLKVNEFDLFPDDPMQYIKDMVDTNGDDEPDYDRLQQMIDNGAGWLSQPDHPFYNHFKREGLLPW